MNNSHTYNGSVAPQATAQQGRLTALSPTTLLWQVQRLSAWLSEWELEMKLRKAPMPVDDSAPATEEQKRELTHLVSYYDLQVSCGEIRLLSPQLIPGCSRPLYFAVVSDWNDKMKLIAPYGYFSEPASTGELFTGRKNSDLRVLCLWNSHTLPINLVAQSWFVDTMSKKELDEARIVFEHVTFGHELPTHLVERVGPPICDPKDPRTVYQKEQMEIMRPLARKAIESVK